MSREQSSEQVNATFQKPPSQQSVGDHQMLSGTLALLDRVQDQPTHRHAEVLSVFAVCIKRDNTARSIEQRIQRNEVGT